MSVDDCDECFTEGVTNDGETCEACGGRGYIEFEDEKVEGDDVI